MLRLSDHFTLEELTFSPRLATLGVTNQPNAMQKASLVDLCDHILEPVRKHFGLPVLINSGFRCPELNNAVGGVSASQHTMGQAADIHIPGVRNDAVWNFIITHLSFDQCIAERLSMDDGSAGWVHVSYYYGHNRGEALSCPTKGNYQKGLVYGGI